jgi:hypothetical protein
MEKCQNVQTFKAIFGGGARVGAAEYLLNTSTTMLLARGGNVFADATGRIFQTSSANSLVVLVTVVLVLQGPPVPTRARCSEAALKPSPQLSYRCGKVLCSVQY